MTPKEKAEELVNQLHEVIANSDGLSNKVLAYEKAKQCALIAVDEILNSIPFDYEFTEKFVIYWNEVKQEIKKL